MARRVTACVCAPAAIMASVPDIIDADNGVYVNMLTVVYQSIEFPDADPQSTVVLVVEAGVCLDRRELLRQVEQLHFTRDAQGQPQHVPFISREEYGHASWGAEGATLAILIGVASYAAAGIVGGVAWDGLKAIGKRIGSAMGPAWPQPDALDGQMAIRRARQIASARFADVDPSDLTVLSVHVADARATVVLRGADGSTFTVEPDMFDNGAIGPITRAYPKQD